MIKYGYIINIKWRGYFLFDNYDFGKKVFLWVGNWFFLFFLKCEMVFIFIVKCDLVIVMSFDVESLIYSKV